MSEILKEDRYSKVWREGDWVYKQQHEFLHRNEVYCYWKMYPSGLVVEIEEIDRNTIKMPFLDSTPSLWVIPEQNLWWEKRILIELWKAEIRHGDLTEYALRFTGGKIYLIDFSESRSWEDPRPDKRPEGDAYWLRKTFTDLGLYDNSMDMEWYEKLASRT